MSIRQKGFTLIELMAVLALLTIIAIIAVPSINNILKNAESDADGSTLSMIEHAASIAYVDTDRKLSKLPNGPGYTVQYLVDNGYLDYDYSAKGARTGAVTHTGDGQFTYFGDNLLSEENHKEVHSHIGNGNRQIHNNLNPDLTYRLSFNYETLGGPPLGNILVYPYYAGGTNSWYTVDGSKQKGFGSVVFKPKAREVGLLIYGGANNRESLERDVKFTNLVLEIVPTK